MNDPYNILGVSKNASQEDISKAFKQLATKYHPDKNPNNIHEASLKFKELTSAYDKIGDSNKRKQYDFYGNPSFSFRNNNDIGEIFNEYINGFFNKKTGVKLRTKISLKEAYYGCHKKVKREIMEDCGDCYATGSTEWQNCKNCDGRGSVPVHQAGIHFAISCAYCNGKGKTSKKACGNCNGRGEIVKEERDIEFKIPAGIEDGMNMKIVEDTLREEFLVIINIEKEENMQRRQMDLFSLLEVDYSTLVLGGQVKYKLFDNEIDIKVPPRTKSGSRLKIKGLGMPHIQNFNFKGDLYLEMNLFIPKEINKEHEKLLKNLSKFN